MITHKSKLPWYKQIMHNLSFYKFWKELAHDSDALANDIIDKYGFVGFLTYGF